MAQTITCKFDKLWENTTKSGKPQLALAGYDPVNREKFRATFWPDTNDGQLAADVRALQEGSVIEATYELNNGFKNLKSVKAVDGGERGPLPPKSSGGKPPAGGGYSKGSRGGEFRTPAQMLKVSAINIAAQLVHEFMDLCKPAKSAMPKTMDEYLAVVGSVYQKVNGLLQPLDGGVKPVVKKENPAEDRNTGADEAPAAPADETPTDVDDDDIPF